MVKLIASLKGNQDYSQLKTQNPHLDCMRCSAYYLGQFW